MLEACYLGVVGVVQVNSSVVTTIEPACSILDLPYIFVSEQQPKAGFQEIKKSAGRIQPGDWAGNAPPVGSTLFVASAVGRVSISQMVPYILCFLLVMIIVQLLITYVPPITTFLPSLME